jgi:phage-related holin
MNRFLNVIASTNVAKLVDKLIHAESWKIGLYLFLGAIFQFLAPIADFLVAILILTIVDYFTGVAAAKRREETVVISNSWKRTLFKLSGFLLLIIATETVSVIFLGDYDFKLSYGASVSIVLVEIQSISENTGIDIFGKLKSILPEKKS